MAARPSFAFLTSAVSLPRSDPSFLSRLFVAFVRLFNVLSALFCFFSGFDTADAGVAASAIAKTATSIANPSLRAFIRTLL
jgi:hypothetical protein